MKKQTNVSARGSVQLIKLLNTALKIEYSLIVHYPRLASEIQDDETRKLALELGTASVAHADIVARAITKLGGKPVWAFTPLPDNQNIVNIFQDQLKKQEESYKLHLEAAGLISPDTLAAAFESLAADEKRHIEMVKRILQKLSHS